MKKFLLIIAYLFICVFGLKAQPNLYGLASSGGSNNGGTILNYLGTTATTALENFNSPDGTYPERSAQIQASDGILYGMTYGGGSSGEGVIFSYNPSTSILYSIGKFYWWRQWWLSDGQPCSGQQWQSSG